MNMRRVWAMGLGAALALTVAGQAGAQTIKVGKDNRTLEVSGLGTASAEPDLAKIHVGFTIYGASLTEGYKNASDLSNAIVKALNAAGAAKSDIESQSQMVQPLNDYELKNQPAALKGMRYRASQNWTVRVEVKDVAKMLDAAVQAGANQSGQVEWMMKDNSALERQAVAHATEQAKALAAEMASGMGVKLGVLIYATTDVGSPIVRPMPMMAMAKMSTESTQPLEIEAQRIERSITVKAVYAIE